ncbi:MAG: sensor histidine kinase, partial [Acidimicrobiales bacterium]
QLSSLLLLAFIVDAAVARWRAGDPNARRQAWTMGGSLALFVVAAAGHAALVQAGAVESPYLISLFFLVPVAAMGSELSYEVVRAAQLTRQLRHSEARLRDSEEGVALAADAAQLGVWTWDIAADRIWTTGQARERLAAPSTDAPTLAWLLRGLHPDDRAPVERAIQGTLNGDSRLETECRVALPGGAVRWVVLRGRVEVDDDRRPVRLRAVSADVTRRKLAEIESQRSREEVAHLSRVASLGELSGSLAHELNQPLTAILSNAQAARRLLGRAHPDLADVRDILDDIVADDQRAGEVIRRLRSLFKKGEMQREPLDLTDVVRQTLTLLNGELVNRNVTLQQEFDARPLPVTADRVQLQQVVLNLVVNGSDAMASVAPARRWLRVRTDRPDEGGARFTVSDAGAGIPRDLLELVFDPFVSTKPQGLGLGLALCRTIIAAHGGRLWAENNSEGGATFVFTLPPGGASPS